MLQKWEDQGCLPMQRYCKLLASMPSDGELNDLIVFPHGLTSLNLGTTALFSFPQAPFTVWAVSPSSALNIAL